VRFEREGVPASRTVIHKRFFAEAGESAARLETLRTELTYDRLPRIAPGLQAPPIGF